MHRAPLEPGSTLPNAVQGQRAFIQVQGLQIGLYSALPSAAAAHAWPLLLVHSVNAAASAYDIKPLFEHYGHTRPVFALDLPGFGISQRTDLLYTPRLMTDAIRAAIGHIQSRTGVSSVDLAAVSLGCEFAARVAVEQPGHVRSLALISPTGLERRTRAPSADGTLAKPWLHSLVGNRLWGKPLFNLLTTAPSVRFFLQKTWGSAQIDEGLLNYCLATARQPGAHYAPLRFIEGRLFSSDIVALYQSLTQLVWISHGVRGDFVDYSRKHEFLQRPNWQDTVFDTGAFAHFEAANAFVAAYDAFMHQAANA
jgi:pimeloyl-ACP methyl ester carboxylesterase